MNYFIERVCRSCGALKGVDHVSLQAFETVPLKVEKKFVNAIGDERPKGIEEGEVSVKVFYTLCLGCVGHE